MTATLAVHSILTAEDKVKETARQGTVIGGGLAGGALAGLAVSTICGPGAPICAVVTVLIGSIIGVSAGEKLSDAFEEEVMEFRTWKIN